MNRESLIKTISKQKKNVVVVNDNKEERFTIRITKEMKEDIFLYARSMGKSATQFVDELLQDFLDSNQELLISLRNITSKTKYKKN